MKTKRLNRIREVLDEKELSQQWLAHQAQLTYASVNMYYNGKREPSLETLFAVARALKISPKELING